MLCWLTSLRETDIASCIAFTGSGSDRLTDTCAPPEGCPLHEVTTGHGSRRTTNRTRRGGLDRPFLSEWGQIPWPLGLCGHTPPGTCSRSIRRVSIAPVGRLSKTPQNRWGRYGVLLLEPAALIEQCRPTSPCLGSILQRFGTFVKAQLGLERGFFSVQSACFPPGKPRWSPPGGPFGPLTGGRAEANAGSAQKTRAGPSRDRPRKDSHQLSTTAVYLRLRRQARPPRTSRLIVAGSGTVTVKSSSVIVSVETPDAWLRIHQPV
jgi:hypothetical protein